MNHLMNMMAMRAQQSMGSFAGTRQGLISAYDPKEYAINRLAP